MTAFLIVSSASYWITPAISLSVPSKNGVRKARISSSYFLRLSGLFLYLTYNSADLLRMAFCLTDNALERCCIRKARCPSGEVISGGIAFLEILPVTESISIEFAPRTVPLSLSAAISSARALLACSPKIFAINVNALPRPDPGRLPMAPGLTANLLINLLSVKPIILPPIVNEPRHQQPQAALPFFAYQIETTAFAKLLIPLPH